VAGLRKGDEVIALNGKKIYHPIAILTEEKSMTNGTVRALTLTVRRDGQRFDRDLVPEKPLQPAKSAPSLGITAWQGTTDVKIVHPLPTEQIQEGTGQIFATLGAVFSRNSDIGFQQLGGAVMIIRLYSNLFQSENGWRQVLWWSVIINVNLALLNLLPFPVLDGGHVVLALLEVVRRRPVSALVLQYLQTACAVVLIGFMLFLAFFDTGDWVRSARSNHDQPLVFAPKP